MHKKILIAGLVYYVTLLISVVALFTARFYALAGDKVLLSIFVSYGILQVLFFGFYLKRLTKNYVKKTCHDVPTSQLNTCMPNDERICNKCKEFY